MSAGDGGRFPTDYVRAVLGKRDELLESVLRRSLGTQPTIQVDDNAGRLLGILTRLARPRRVLEIGTLFGYSTIFIARALTEDATLVTLETNVDAAELAVENLQAAGIAQKVLVRSVDALEYLRDYSGLPFELIFVDGRKSEYPAYLKALHPHLADGGLLVTDDAFAAGDFSQEDKVASDGALGISTYVRAIGRAPSLTSAFAGTESGLLISVKERW